MEENLNPEILSHKILRMEKAITGQPRLLIPKIQLKSGFSSRTRGRTVGN
jgi:hypothetical protein